MDISEIIQLYQSGKSCRFIGKQFSIDHKTISKILHKNGIKIFRNRIIISENQIQEIIDLYQNHSIVYIAKQFNLSPKTIKKIFLQNKINIKSIKEQKTKFTDTDIFSIIDSHQKAYWLGFLSADGNLSKNYQLSFQLAEKDYQTVIDFHQFMGGKDISSVGKCITNLNGKQFIGYRARFKSSQLAQDLIKHHIVPNKTISFSLSKSIPEEYFSSYILGIFDGDGSIGYYNKRLSFKITSSKIAAREIQDILVKYCKLNKTKIKELKNCAIITYCGNRNVDKIMKFLYSHYSGLKRKHNIYRQYLDRK